MKCSVVLALTAAMNLTLAASASQVADLRARYLETVGGIHSLDVQFTLRSVAKTGSFSQRGRWVRDGLRQLLVVSESDFGRNWESFDGANGHQVTYDPEQPGRIREIITSPATPPRLREAYCIDTWLGLRLKDSQTDLAGQLASATARVVSENGEHGDRTWDVDLGDHPSPNGTMFHWTVTLAEHYGCLPVEMTATPVGESAAAQTSIRNLGTVRYRLSDWTAYPEPFTGGEQWLPTRMDVAFTLGSWSLILDSVRLNSSIPDADYRPPAPTVGTQLITETIAGQRTIEVHRKDELLQEYLQQHAADAAEEMRQLESAGAAVAVRDEGFRWHLLRWAAMCSLLAAAAVYAFRRRLHRTPI